VKQAADRTEVLQLRLTSRHAFAFIIFASSGPALLLLSKAMLARRNRRKCFSERLPLLGTVSHARYVMFQLTEYIVLVARPQANIGGDHEGAKLKHRTAVETAPWHSPIPLDLSDPPSLPLVPRHHHYRFIGARSPIGLTLLLPIDPAHCMNWRSIPSPCRSARRAWIAPNSVSNSIRTGIISSTPAKSRVYQILPCLYVPAAWSAFPGKPAMSSRVTSQTWVVPANC